MISALTSKNTSSLNPLFYPPFAEMTVLSISFTAWRACTHLLGPDSPSQVLWRRPKSVLESLLWWRECRFWSNTNVSNLSTWWTSSQESSYKLYCCPSTFLYFADYIPWSATKSNWKLVWSATYPAKARIRPMVLIGWTFPRAVYLHGSLLSWIIDTFTYI